ncbi:MAG: hypothetical protein ACRENP_28350, partial [Longimicrobiales bacterium]
MRTLRSAAVMTLLLIPTALTGQQEVSTTGKPTLAVLPIYAGMSASPDADRTATAITRLIASSFSSQGAVRVLDSDRLARLLSRQPQLTAGRWDDGSAMRAGRLAGARLVLVGSVTVDGQVTQLEVRALDVTNGSPVGLPFSATGQMDQLAT